jgi:hypothetical protein
VLLFGGRNVLSLLYRLSRPELSGHIPKPIQVLHFESDESHAALIVAYTSLLMAYRSPFSDFLRIRIGIVDARYMFY